MTTEIDTRREAYRKVYDTGLASLLSAIWGGSLHMGLFANPDEPFAEAQMRAKNHIANAARLERGQRVIEAACGVGTTARHLVKTYGVTVHATNISEQQLAEAREAAEREGLSDRLTFAFADYHKLDLPDASFDCWWCQEALLYAVDKRQVLSEARRVTRPGGMIVMTDLLLSRDMPAAERASFTTDMKAPDMWSIGDWDRLIADMGFEVAERQDWSPNTRWTFENVGRNLARVRDDFARRIGPEAVAGTEHRIGIQLAQAKAGRLGWCFYALRA